MIFLMGMPYSGKSTLGLALSTALEAEFIDLDLEIEKATKKSITEIFKMEGEEAFRDIESKILKTIISSQSSRAVVSLGGGTPCFNDNLELIKSRGLSIFLNVEPEELIRRSEKDDKRPLLKGANKASIIQQMYDKRKDCYRKADVVITGNDLLVEDLLQKIRS